MRTVQYAGNNLVIEDDTMSLAQIKESMAEIFPELQNATPTQEGEIIKFEVKAGTKGTRTVQYAGNNLVIEDDTMTLAQIKESMAEIFPELQNATPTQEGEIVKFEVKAGTKGLFSRFLQAIAKLRG